MNQGVKICFSLLLYRFCFLSFILNYALCYQVSQLTFVPTLVARPSHSVCLTIGRSSLETQWMLQASLELLSLRHVNARVSKKVSQPWTTTWTNCKSLDTLLLALVSFIHAHQIKSTLWDRTVQNTVSTNVCQKD